MRTLTLEKWFLKNRITDFIDGKRRYSVEGAIVFELHFADIEPDLAKLADSIREVDSLFPWRDDVYPGREFESIRYLSEGEVTVHNLHTPLKQCWFHIYPGGKSLRKSQVYAYEKYLARLAEELAKKRIFGIAKVSSVIVARASSDFSVPI